MLTLTEPAFKATYDEKAGKLIITRGDRDFPFSESTAETIEYAYSDDNTVEKSDVILTLAFGFAFLGKVEGGRIHKSIVYISLTPWNLDEGFYLLKKIS